MRFMKKSFLALSVGIVVLLLCTLSILAADTVVGKVYASDIQAYLNDYPIPIYNVNGNAVVMAADLRSYGFQVVYNNAQRRSEVTLNPSTQKIIPINTPRDLRNENVYESDITVTLNGKTVPGFNVAGNMAIRFSDLKEYGIHVYDNDSRTTNIWIDSLPYFFYTEKLIEDGVVPHLAVHFFSITFTADGWSTPTGTLTDDHHAVNALISHILGRILTDDMTETEKIAAIYDYIVKGYSHSEDGFYKMPESWSERASGFFENSPAIYGINSAAFLKYTEKYNVFAEKAREGTPKYICYDPEAEMRSTEPIQLYQTDMYAYPRVASMFHLKTGVCSYYASLFKYMVGHIGYDSTIVNGAYIYNNGSKTEHFWNNIRIGDRYYWIDADLDSINWHKYAQYSAAYARDYFLKTDADWTARHYWNTANFPACP